MTTPPPPPQSGAAREVQAAAIGAAIGAVFSAAEMALIAALSRAVRPAVITRGIIGAARRRLMRTAAATIAGTEPETTRILHRGGFARPPGEVSRLLGAAGQAAHEHVGSVYDQAVSASMQEVRGGMPYSSLSYSRVQVAQKALDKLAAEGITGFTDKAGRNWDLASYVEMATRTAVSNAYDDLMISAVTRSGGDLVLVGTDSAEGTCPKCLPYLGRLLSINGGVSGVSAVTDASGQQRQETVYATLDEARAAGFRHASCRCTLLPWHDGADFTADFSLPRSPAKTAAQYAASQEQRRLERNVRDHARRAQAAMSPQGRGKARRHLAAARAVSEAHRQREGLHVSKVSARRREQQGKAR